MIVTRKDVFFCYDLDLAEYLRYEKKIPIITVGMTLDTKRIYTLFSRSNFLSTCIQDYNNSKLSKQSSISNHKK